MKTQRRREEEAKKKSTEMDACALRHQGAKLPSGNPRSLSRETATEQKATASAARWRLFKGTVLCHLTFLFLDVDALGVGRCIEASQHR